MCHLQSTRYVRKAEKKTFRANLRTKSTNIITRSSSRVSYDPLPRKDNHKGTRITLINDVQGQITHIALFLQLQYDHFLNDSSQTEPTTTRYLQLPERKHRFQRVQVLIGRGPTTLTEVAGGLAEAVVHLVFKILHERRTLP